MYKIWTENEDSFLVANFGNYSDENLAELLDRSKSSISARARRLKLNKSQKRWDEVYALRSNIGLSKPRKYNLNTLVFKHIDSQEKAYWLGFLWADGCVRKKENRLTLVLNKKDVETLKAFCKFIQTDIPIKEHPNNAYKVVITSKILVDTLILHGIEENKSYKDLEPQCVPDELVAAFIRGLFDGDGCISGNKQKVYVSVTGNHKTCKWLQKQCSKLLNISGSIIYKSNYAVWRFGGRKQVERFVKFLYSNTSLYMMRKYMKCKDESLV